MTLLVFLHNGFRTLPETRFAELPDIPAETFGKHLGVEPRELLEDRLKHELFGQGISLHSSLDGHIKELCSLRGKNVVVSDVPEVDPALGY